MSRPIADIAQDWVNKIQFTCKGTNLLIVDSVTTFKTCNTSWAIPCVKITIEEVEYTIASVITDVSITIKAVVAIVDSNNFNWTLNAPFFLHGTPIQADAEREMLRKCKDVSPMIYLFEPTREDFKNITSYIERETNLRFAIIKETGRRVEKTDEIYKTSIEQMRRLTEAFVDTILNQHSEVDKYNVTYSMITYTKYGVIKKNNGAETSLFGEVSGQELFIDIPLKRICSCNKNCNCTN